MIKYVHVHGRSSGKTCQNIFPSKIYKGLHNLHKIFPLESNLPGIIKTFSYNQSLLINVESAKPPTLKSWKTVSGYMDEKTILINKIFQS